MTSNISFRHGPRSRPAGHVHSPMRTMADEEHGRLVLLQQLLNLALADSHSWLHLVLHHITCTCTQAGWFNAYLMLPD